MKPTSLLASLDASLFIKIYTCTLCTMYFCGIHVLKCSNSINIFQDKNFQYWAMD